MVDKAMVVYNGTDGYMNDRDGTKIQWPAMMVLSLRWY